jgi:hypothetical protein
MWEKRKVSTKIKLLELSCPVKGKTRGEARHQVLFCKVNYLLDSQVVMEAGTDTDDDLRKNAHARHQIWGSIIYR